MCARGPTGRVIPWLFHRDGKPIRDFYDAWHKACKAAGMPGRIPHDFRRTAVRNIERAGVPRSAAMQLTGHITESVYRRYAIVDEAMLNEGVEKLATLYATEGNVDSAAQGGAATQGGVNASTVTIGAGRR